MAPRHSRTTARGIGRCASSSRVGTTTWHSSSQNTASPCGCTQGTHAGTDGQGQTQPPPGRHLQPLLISSDLRASTPLKPERTAARAALENLPEPARDMEIPIQTGRRNPNRQPLEVRHDHPTLTLSHHPSAISTTSVEAFSDEFDGAMTIWNDGYHTSARRTRSPST